MFILFKSVHSSLFRLQHCLNNTWSFYQLSTSFIIFTLFIHFYSFLSWSQYILYIQYTARTARVFFINSKLLRFFNPFFIHVLLVFLVIKSINSSRLRLHNAWTTRDILLYCQLLNCLYPFLNIFIHVHPEVNTFFFPLEVRILLELPVISLLIINFFFFKLLSFSYTFSHVLYSSS